MNGVDDVGGGGGGGGDCCRWLHQLLTQESLVSSHTEAIAIVESIRQHDWTLEEEDLAEASQRTVHETFGRYVLCEYFGVPKEEVTKLLQKYCKVTDQDEHGKIDGDDEHEDGNQDEDECHHDMIDYHDENENDDREEVLGPGECELCERDATKLTRHHLIPKSTWKRIEPITHVIGPLESSHDRYSSSSRIIIIIKVMEAKRRGSASAAAGTRSFSTDFVQLQQHVRGGWSHRSSRRRRTTLDTSSVASTNDCCMPSLSQSYSSILRQSYVSFTIQYPREIEKRLDDCQVREVGQPSASIQDAMIHSQFKKDVLPQSLISSVVDVFQPTSKQIRFKGKTWSRGIWRNV